MPCNASFMTMSEPTSSHKDMLSSVVAGATEAATHLKMTAVLMGLTMFHTAVVSPHSAAITLSVCSASGSEVCTSGMEVVGCCCKKLSKEVGATDGDYTVQGSKDYGR